MEEGSGDEHDAGGQKQSLHTTLGKGEVAGTDTGYRKQRSLTQEQRLRQNQEQVLEQAQNSTKGSERVRNIGRNKQCDRNRVRVQG